MLADHTTDKAISLNGVDFKELLIVFQYDLFTHIYNIPRMLLSNKLISLGINVDYPINAKRGYGYFSISADSIIKDSYYYNNDASVNVADQATFTVFYR